MFSAATAKGHRHATDPDLFHDAEDQHTWVQLSPKERFEFFSATIKPLLAKHPAVKVRFYDAEAFSGRVSDIAVWESADIKAY